MMTARTSDHGDGADNCWCSGGGDGDGDGGGDVDVMM